MEQTQQAVRAGSSRSIIEPIAAVLAVIGASVGGSQFTMPAIQEGWYASLTKPPMQPPQTVFGPVWGVLYILIAAAYILWWRSPQSNAAQVRPAFWIQIVLNFLWSFVFFGMRSPVGGAVVIVTLIASVVWLMVAYRRSHLISAWLTVPYLAWITFAAYLNIGIVALN